MKHAEIHTKPFLTISNCLIIILIVVFLIKPLGLFIAKTVGVNFDFESGIMPDTFIMEDRTRTRPPMPSLETIRDGKFQATMEKAVADLTPKRDNVLQINAALQRFFIESANGIFRFKTYHTYFESSRIYIPEHNALMIAPQKNNEPLISGTIAFCEGLKKLAKDLPEKRFIVCIRGGYYCTAVNPALDLISNPLLPEKWANTYREQLKDQENILFYTDVGQYDSLDEYFKYYYRTDHHWNMEGVNQSLETIYKELGEEPYDPVPLEPVPDYEWGGTLNKTGLYPLFETVEKPAGDLFTNYKFKDLSGKKDLGNINHNLFYDANPLRKRYKFYGLYFDDGENNRIVNPNSSTEKIALQVANSYGALSRFALAGHYREVVPFWHIMGVSGTRGLNEKTRLRELIKKHKADDIYFVATPINTSKLAVNFPHYFD